MNTIITIGRELGSGGRTIGKLVASKIGIPYYDRDLIDKAAEKSGLAASFIESNEQKSSLFYQLGMGMSYGFSAKIPSLFDQIYIAQAKVINELADKGACVIVGRCADYILKERRNLLRIFIYADIERRVERAIQSYGMPEQSAKKEIQKSDNERARHYNIFTDRIWGDRANYDLLLNSARIGIEQCAEMICGMAGGNNPSAS